MNGEGRNKMSRIKDIKFIWGDLHLGSKSLFDKIYSKTFKCKEDYYQTIIEENNRRAGDNTVVLFLGDVGFVKDFWVLEKMKGYKILIKGNHDRYKDKVYEKYFKEIYDHPIYTHPRIIFSHVPTLVEDGIINIHGHTHEITLAKDNYFNICPERTGYQPVTMKWVNRRLSKFKKPSIKFLEEWFKDIQLTKPREDLVVNEDGLIDVQKSLELRKEKENEIKL
jgi:calcineurin-like phosphoesterase family protein